MDSIRQRLSCRWWLTLIAKLRCRCELFWFLLYKLKSRTSEREGDGWPCKRHYVVVVSSFCVPTVKGEMNNCRAISLFDVVERTPRVWNQNWSSKDVALRCYFPDFEE